MGSLNLFIDSNQIHSCIYNEWIAVTIKVRVFKEEDTH